MYVVEYFKQNQNKSPKKKNLGAVVRREEKTVVKSDIIDPRREQYLKDMNYTKDLLEKRA